MALKCILAVLLLTVSALSCKKREITLPDAQAELLLGAWELVGGVSYMPIEQHYGRIITYDRTGRYTIREVGEKNALIDRFRFETAEHAHGRFHTTTFIRHALGVSQWFLISNDTLYTQALAFDLPDWIYVRIK
jgi:hypothetical protein